MLVCVSTLDCEKKLNILIQWISRLRYAGAEICKSSCVTFVIGN
jgi:hypothetical protein